MDIPHFMMIAGGGVSVICSFIMLTFDEPGPESIMGLILGSVLVIVGIFMP